MASIAPRDLGDARSLLARVPAKASAVEYRFDLCGEEIPVGRLQELDARPVLATWRTAAEGGNFSGSPEEYRRKTREAYAAGATVDVEQSSGLLSNGLEFPDRRRVVVSLHAPFRTARGLGGRSSKRCAAPRRARVKLVAGAPDVRAALKIVGDPEGPGRSLRRDLPDGARQARPAAFCAPSSGASLAYGPVGRRDRGGADPARRPPGGLRDRPAAPFRGALRDRRARTSRGRSRRCSTTRSSARATSRASTCRSRSRTSSGRKPQELAFDPPFRGFSVTQPWKRKAAASGAPSRGRAGDRARPTRSFARAGAGGGEHRRRRVLRSAGGPRHRRGPTAVILGAGGAARAAVVAARRLGYEVFVASRRDDEADALAEAAGRRLARLGRRARRPRRTFTSTRPRRAARTGRARRCSRRSSPTGRSSSTACTGATARPTPTACRAGGSLPRDRGARRCSRPRRSARQASSAPRTSLPRKSAALLAAGEAIVREREGARALSRCRAARAAACRLRAPFRRTSSPPSRSSSACGLRARSVSCSRASRAARRWRATRSWAAGRRRGSTVEPGQARGRARRQVRAARRVAPLAALETAGRAAGVHFATRTCRPFGGRRRLSRLRRRAALRGDPGPASARRARCRTASFSSSRRSWPSTIRASGCCC